MCGPCCPAPGWVPQWSIQWINLISFRLRRAFSLNHHFTQLKGGGLISLGAPGLVAMGVWVAVSGRSWALHAPCCMVA